jgi:hypothetical protein
MHLKTLRILFYLTTTLWINSWADPTQNVYFSEFFANPTYTSDSEGEFFEVFNSGPEKNIVIDNNNTQTQILLKSNTFTLFCNENANFSCDFPLPFALVNQKEYVLKIIFQNQVIDSTIVPAALDGISWQRNANIWEPSTFSFLSNRQTPGFGDLKTHPEQRFTQIHTVNFIQTNNSLVIEWQQTQDDTIVFTNLTKTSLKYAKNGLAKLQQMPLEGKTTNWNLWSYKFPLNDIPDTESQILFFQNKPFLFISEINPFPSVNSTEWIEISNLGGESFPLEFSHLKIGSKKN